MKYVNRSASWNSWSLGCGRSMRIASKSATLGEVMSKHKLVKKFLTSLPRPYEERVNQEVKANDSQEKLRYAKTNNSNRNSDSSRGRGRGSYSRGRGRGRGQGRGRGNTQNQGQRDSLKNHSDNQQKGKQKEQRDLSHIKCYLCDKFGHFVSRCPDQKQDYEANLSETHEGDVNHEEGTFFVMNHIQETIFMNEEKYTPPKSESNTDKDDVWYFDNGGNHMIGKGSILFQGKNGEQKLLKDIYYIPALHSNVISLGQATISGCDIRIREEDTFTVIWNDTKGAEFQQPLNENTTNRPAIEEQPTHDSPRHTSTVHVTISSTVHDTVPSIVHATVPRQNTHQVTVHSPQTPTDEDDYEDDDITILIRHSTRNTSDTGTREEVQALRAWNTKLDNSLKEMGFQQCIEVSQGKDCVKIKQERYERKILKESGMENCNANLYPMERDLKLSKVEDEPEVEAT
ncbi:retrovirus-related pol polyprotein from transposon TNT 1-94 [Tanacetum coccineum]